MSRTEKLFAQSASGGKAKSYQVRQVRQELQNLDLKP
jgi:hypothetical protein